MWSSDEISEIIFVKDLSHYYSDNCVLKSISLSVRKGELHGLIGPDSAGKSTLMRLLCGLIPIQKGEIKVLGLSVSTDYSQIRAQIGYMPQRFSLYQDLSVEENLLFFARLFGEPLDKRKQLLEELYAFSRLEEFRHRRTSALSGGMKQKLALSCALIHHPDLLILDEPTYGVDPVSRQEFWHLLKKIQDDGTTILVSTPYMEEAELCDKITLLFAGRLLISDTPLAIKQHWDKQVYSIQCHFLKETYLHLKQMAEIDSCQLFGNELHIIVSRQNSDYLIKKIKQEFQDLSLQIRAIEPSIEDIFLSYMQTTNYSTMDRSYA
ncbi:MAG: ABC transporter ATP-binding protein [Chitinispirillaceae bacterium]|nr:ABC transporter ATP-binding protein [Chitinispirillaceae bacterium]